MTCGHFLILSPIRRIIIFLGAAGYSLCSHWRWQRPDRPGEARRTADLRAAARVLAVCWCGMGATRRGRRAGRSGPVSSVGGHSGRSQSAPIGWCATAGQVCRLQRGHLVGCRHSSRRRPTAEVAAAAARLNVPFVSCTCPPVGGRSGPSRRSARLGVYAIELPAGSAARTSLRYRQGADKEQTVGLVGLLVLVCTL